MYVIYVIYMMKIIMDVFDAHRRRAHEWIALRYYQYELTFGLYMLYPLERAVFS
jgi:hypothetical protein